MDWTDTVIQWMEALLRNDFVVPFVAIALIIAMGIVFYAVSAAIVQQRGKKRKSR